MSLASAVSALPQEASLEQLQSLSPLANAYLDAAKAIHKPAQGAHQRIGRLGSKATIIHMISAVGRSDLGEAFLVSDKNRRRRRKLNFLHKIIKKAAKKLKLGALFKFLKVKGSTCVASTLLHVLSY